MKKSNIKHLILVSAFLGAVGIVAGTVTACSSNLNPTPGSQKDVDQQAIDSAKINTDVPAEANAKDVLPKDVSAANFINYIKLPTIGIANFSWGIPTYNSSNDDMGTITLSATAAAPSGAARTFIFTYSGFMTPAAIDLNYIQGYRPAASELVAHDASLVLPSEVKNGG